MVKQRKGILDDPVLLTFGIVLGVIVLGLFILFVNTAKWGPCWAGAVDEMGEIIKGFNRLETTTGTVSVAVTMDECVWGFYFVSEDGMRKFRENAGEFKDDIKCYGSSIVFMPYFESKETVWEPSIWKIPEKKWSEAKDWLEKNVRGIKPQCRSLDHDVNSFAIEGPGQGKSKTVCLELSKIGEGDEYEYGVKEGRCDA